MSYKLEKPYTDRERADFICEYNHRKHLQIEETENAIFALEADEIIENDEVIINPDYETELAQAREIQFEKDFFETTLGWIRRKVTMKDGSQKDFLSDLLLPIKAGLDLGQEVTIITYEKPDFSNETTKEYMESLQTRKTATQEFIIECLNRTVSDFGI